MLSVLNLSSILIFFHIFKKKLCAQKVFQKHL